MDDFRGANISVTKVASANDLFLALTCSYRDKKRYKKIKKKMMKAL